MTDATLDTISNPGPDAGPKDEADDEDRALALPELGAHVQAARPDCVLDWAVALGELTIEAAPASIAPFAEFLRADPKCRFSTLVDVTAVDRPSRPSARFDVVYHFLSMHRNQRVRVKCAVREDEALASLTDVHPSANWFEREVYDMFGIPFEGHPDLRRILTDYGFQGHPLRKDFPTTGYTEVRYDEAKKRVVHEPVSLVQEYRQFDFMSPWEGAGHVLRGEAGGADGAADGEGADAADGPGKGAAKAAPAGPGAGS